MRPVGSKTHREDLQLSGTDPPLPSCRGKLLPYARSVVRRPTGCRNRLLRTTRIDCPWWWHRAATCATKNARVTKRTGTDLRWRSITHEIDERRTHASIMARAAVDAG